MAFRCAFVASRPVAAVVAAAGVAIAATGGAWAMRLSPMVVEMTTSGANATARIEVQNINAANLAYETRVTRINYDDKGVMSETPADGDFLVFPPQGVLPPGARQVIRLQWVGDPKLAASRAYYVSVNQLPVALARDQTAATGAQVQVVYHMKALVTVAPPKAAPQVATVSAKPVMIAAKAPPPVPGAAKPTTPPAAAAPVPGVELVVRNTGTRYAMMAGEPWTLEGTGVDGKPAKVVISTDELSHAIGAGYLAPLGGLRTFQVPTATKFSGPVKVRFGK